MNADRRNTLIAASITLGFNIRAKRSRGTVCWLIRDTASALADAASRPGLAKPAIGLGLGAVGAVAYHHLVHPMP